MTSVTVGATFFSEASLKKEVIDYASLSKKKRVAIDGISVEIALIGPHQTMKNDTQNLQLVNSTTSVKQRKEREIVEHN